MNATQDPDRGAEEDAELIRREREWLLSRLREVPGARARLEERERDLARAARAAGIGWDEIAEALGMDGGEPARDRFGEPEPGDVPF